MNATRNVSAQDQNIDQPAVIAAIPNYNMAESLRSLLEQLIAEDYTAIFVLDDCSSDDSREVVESFGDRVRLVTGEKNVGAGGNRDRILDFVDEFGEEAIVHFYDADTELLTTDGVAKKVRLAMTGKDIGFVGGMILDKSGLQILFNHGPRQSLYSLAGGWVQELFKGRLPAPVKRIFQDWPDRRLPQVRRPVFWTTEGNLMIKLGLLKSVGGFSTKFREQEIQDLALRLFEKGKTNWFDPSIVVRHLEVSVRPRGRNLRAVRDQATIAKRSGYGQWFRPEGRFRPKVSP